MPAQPNASLANGLACLQAVVSAGRPLGTREAARQLGLTHTRANRLLGTLADLGLVAQDEQRKYRPGAGIHVLAAQSLMGSGLLRTALPELRGLRQEGFTVALGVLWKGMVCYLIHARPGQAFDESIGAHEVVEAGRSTIGMALMSLRSGHLPTDLAATRKRGFGLLHFPDGEVSIGVPVGDPAVAGLAVSAKRLGEEHIAAIAGDLRAAAQRIAVGLAALPGDAS